VVFWEVWCPHCKREVPKLDEMYAKYKGQGLNVVGVTQVSNGKTDEEVAAFISENHVSYPTAKVGPELPNAFAVQGIPAAAVIKDGKVVWRGHPAQLNDEMITGWLGT
jgi:thiol-disulfide isomerase/thioredoxin